MDKIRFFLTQNLKFIIPNSIAIANCISTQNSKLIIHNSIANAIVDFMFQLSDDEFANLKSQIVTSSWGGSPRAKTYTGLELL